MSNYSTSNITWTGVSVPAGASPEPAKAPKALIATRAVEMKDGWTGQVIVGGDVVLQDGGYEKSDEAEQWATAKVVGAIRALFQPKKR